MNTGVLAAVALAFFASPAMAQTISLRPGESVTVTFFDGKVLVEPRVPARPMNDYEMYTLWRAQTQNVSPGVKVQPPVFLKKGEGPPHPPESVAGQIQITMRQVPALRGTAAETVLFFENGYPSTLTYHATMVVDSRASSTDVCEVPRQMLGMEYWPYAIAELDLSHLQLKQPSEPVRCQ